MHIVEAAQLAQAAATGFDIPYSPFGRTYYAAALGSKRKDASFSVADGGKRILTVWCDAGSERLDRFGSPALIAFSPDAPLLVRERAFRLMLAELRHIARRNGVLIAEFALDPRNDPDGLVVTALTQIGALPQARIFAEADLTVSPVELENNLRKGHRQQVRWGEGNLRFVIVDASNPDEAAFGAFRQLHADVAGRVTRPIESWQICFDAIRQGSGGLVLGYLGEKLVSGTLTLDAFGAAYYFSGAYDRGHFDKPLSHAALFRSMLAARARGCVRYNLGEVPVKGMVSDKEFQIGWFKRGFSPQSLVQQVLRLPLAQLEPRVPAVNTGTASPISLRPLTPDDITDTYLSWFKDTVVTQFLEARDITREEAISFMEHGREEGIRFMYAICEAATGKHIGNLKLGDINRETGVSDLVTVIGDRSAWGKGYATEAIKQGMALAFDEHDLRKLSGAIYEHNTGSVKAYLRAGWVIEGALHGHIVRDGRVQDRILVSAFNPRYFPELPTFPKPIPEGWTKI